ncbi:MAG TPA: hypothetical protein VFA03_11985 [Acetobacteraceae bacterium]|nr:hypothetical protein [Acetobacteraceae bacterium]
MDIKPSDLAVGLMWVVFGLAGLFLAAGARDNEMYVFGLSLAGLAVAFDAGLIRRHFNEVDAAAARARAARHV